MKLQGLKKWLPLLLVIVMVCVMQPAAVLAQSPSPAKTWDWDTEGHYDISWYDRNKAAFRLSTAEELAGLAWIVNQGDKLQLQGESKPLREAFTGKTIYLTKDIYLNDHQSTAQDPTAHQWPSIGGSVHTVQNNGVFDGTFDGQGHSISHMYIHNLTVWTEYDARNRGFFGVTAENAAIQNLYLRDGYVRAARSTGGLVGKTGYLNASEDPESKTGFDINLSGHGTIIRNCHNVNTTVITTDSKGVGGIVGAGWNYAIIEGCSNSGNISSIGNYPAGGIAGENEYIIRDCWNTGTISSKGNNAGGIVGSNKLVMSSVSNCYNTGKIFGVYAGGITGFQVGISENCYNVGSVTGVNAGGLFGELKSGQSNKNLYYLSTRTADGAGMKAEGKADMEGKTAEEMKAAGFLAALNGTGSVFTSDSKGVNGGYPIPVEQEKAFGAKTAFSDVQQNAWYADAVNAVMEKGLFDAVGAGKFGPEQPMTRAMLATALYRLADTPAVSDSDVFSDVPKNAAYRDAVAWAYEAGVVSGMTAATFEPKGTINREQIAAMLYRYAKWAGDDTTESGNLSGFTDAEKVSSWAAGPMRWAVGQHLISGMGKSNLAPQGTATRAQAAQILMQFEKTP